ncbi:hypothetical protein [Vibrio sp. Hal054]|uniref:hypothetical protein n=1 Tax=Vibrio sp. Hal054 TaxID=3035158 RepID=UPI00301BCC0B
MDIWSTKKGKGIMRYIFGLLLMFGATCAYLYGLHLYLSAIPNPTVMMFIFGSSLLVSLTYDIKQGFGRRTFVLVLSTLLIFSIAPYLAIKFRMYYLEVIAALKEIPSEELESLGYHHYVNAVKNPMVGVGACFAFSLGLARLSLGALSIKLITKAFFNGQTEPCKYCGK